jgi:hypothetical protein
MTREEATAALNTMTDDDFTIAPLEDRVSDAEYDRLVTAGRQTGRPSLASGVSPQIAFRVPQADKDRLARVAEELGRSQSDVAREAFDKGLELLSV